MGSHHLLKTMPSLGEEGVFDANLDHNIDDRVLIPDDGCFWGSWTRWATAVIIVLVIILLRNLYRDGLAATAKKPVDEAKKVVDKAKVALLKKSAKSVDPTPAPEQTPPPAQEPAQTPAE